MFTRVHSGQTDNAHTFLSMEYIIFRGFFFVFTSYYYNIVLFFSCALPRTPNSFSLSLSLSLSRRLVCFTTFSQQNRDNGFVLLHECIRLRKCALVRIRLLFFSFSNASALQVFYRISQFV